MTKLKGELEIDHERGVIYFHTTDEKYVMAAGIVTPLRICHLPRPIPKERFLDISVGDPFDCNWRSHE